LSSIAIVALLWVQKEMRLKHELNEQIHM